MDSTYLFLWWLLFFLIGLINLPLTFILFKNYLDFGYGFSKTLGLLIVTYTSFTAATLHLFPFTSLSLYLLLLTLFLINLAIFSKNKKTITVSLKQNLRIILLQEILFLLALGLWSTIRGFAPEIRGLEKFMDFGFINSILKSEYFPPADMWFAGKSINYYYFGHIFTAVATKLSQIPAAVSYNLMIATILGLLITGTFSLTSSVFASLGKGFQKIAVRVGLISLLLVAFAGNFQTPIYLVKNGIEKYWYPDATRFIGYFPEVNDKTIHEFPLYSFVVSDLHAHLLDVPFVLLFLAFIWSLVSKSDRQPFTKKLPTLVLTSLTLAATIMTNTWDFASYSLVGGLCLLIGYLVARKRIWEAIRASVYQMIVIVLPVIILVLPFVLNFTSIAEGIRLVHSQTPLWQLGVIWGFPAIMTLLFATTVFFLLKKDLTAADGFILGLVVSSWILIVIPEIVYVKDIYIASHYRANTMFKLTYQSFVMFYLSSGYIAVRLLTKLKASPAKIGVRIFLPLLFTSVLIYPFFAVRSYYRELKQYDGLSGEKWVGSYYPDLYAAIVWLRENVKGQPIIVEASGTSYTDENLVSSYTGLPTVQGWFVHEWLWRGNAEEPQKRSEDVELIYTSASLSTTRGLLEKYGVRYVIVGPFEKEKYPNLLEIKFEKIGEKVFSQGEVTIFRLDT